MSINALMEYTRISKYARYNSEKQRRETWDEQINRVIDMHKKKYAEFLPNIKEEMDIAEYAMKRKWVLGSQRALQFGGRAILEKNARLYNCTVSYCDRPRYFQEAMYLLLCGCGVGFSVQKHHIKKLSKIKTPSGDKIKIKIEDSIEGWADCIGQLMSSYFVGDVPFPECQGKIVTFDYSQIRPAGSIISSSGGKAPGPDGLRNAVEKIKELMENVLDSGQDRLKPINAYDVVMHTSDAVLSGGVRRSATICLFSKEDQEMLNAKTGDWYQTNPQRGRSNNSVVLLRDEVSKKDFDEIVESVKQFGEPGFVWSDDLEALYNPCVEIGMYAYDEQGNSGWSFCNLCELNVKKAKSKEQFLDMCKMGAILGTLQAGYDVFDYLGEVTERIVRKEALLGVSMTGMMDNPDIAFDPELQKEGAKLIRKTNEKLAKKIGINVGARTTCVKPAGCQKPNTLVSTKNGIVQLDEIGDVHGDTWQKHDVEVYTDGENKKSPKFFVNGYAKTKKILLDSGLELEATFNHKYKVINEDNEYVWKRTDELYVGDIMPFSLGEYNGGEIQYLNDVTYTWNKNTRKDYQKDIKTPKTLNEDLALFLGMYYGDGSNHQRGIRISGNSKEKKGFDLITKIVKEQFNIDTKYQEDYREGNRCYIGINSKPLLSWLKSNDIFKEKSTDIVFPLIIRKSPKNIIEKFIYGFQLADGCDKSDRGISYVTTSKKFAEQLTVVLRAIGRECKMRVMPPTESSLGNNNRYWIQERKGRNGDISKISNYRKKYYDILETFGLKSHSVDKIINIEDSYSETYDIEVEETHTYISNSYISHNTTSCILGTASGIHPHHSKRYFRRVQANKLEETLKFFQIHNPLAVEESVWSANNTDNVVTFLCEVPANARTKVDTDALQLLERVKLTQQNWVQSGRNKSLCAKEWLCHNVSNTIHVKDDEWKEVASFIYNNRKYFAGISLLPMGGDKDYAQAPFTTVYTPEEIVKLYGNGSLMASGLIVDGLKAWDDDLWEASNCVLGFNNELDIPEFSSKKLEAKWKRERNFNAKIDWVRRAKQFSDRYFDGDVRKMTYCLKDVFNWKLWCDLKREYKDVDWEEFHEEVDNTKVSDTIACAGGSCEVSFV